MEKYGDSRAAIQDAEKHDEGNEGVWVQVRKILLKDRHLTLIAARFVLFWVG